MNIEQTKEAIRVMQAYVDGKEVEYLGKKWDSKELFKQDWCYTHSPLWNWEHYDYRIKPTATLRPWTADEVPLGSQCRTKGDTKRFLIVRTSDESTRDEWLNKCEHSTDGGKTWLPCGVVEDAK
jgi:hypothetical protein